MENTVLKDAVDEQTEALMLREYHYLVKKIAFQLHNRLPSHILLDDLIQTGTIGLHEAIKTYDPHRGATFATYATLKIRGAMLDDIRQNDWLPRSVQANVKNINQVSATIEGRLGHKPTAKEIAKELGVDLQTYHAMLTDICAGKIVELDHNIEALEVATDENHTPQQDLLLTQMQHLISEYIDHLPEREKQVLAQYYFEDKSLKEIGSSLNISESRVSQLHSQALKRLKEKLHRN